MTASHVDIDTLLLSKGQLPQTFLRGAGIPEAFINALLPLVKEHDETIRCFLIYAQSNQALAEKLSADLQDLAIRCWLAPNGLSDDADLLYHSSSFRIFLVSREFATGYRLEQEVISTVGYEEDLAKELFFLAYTDTFLLDHVPAPPEDAWLRNTLIQRRLFDFTSWADPISYQQTLQQLCSALRLQSQK